MFKINFKPHKLVCIIFLEGMVEDAYLGVAKPKWIVKTDFNTISWFLWLRCVIHGLLDPPCIFDRTRRVLAAFCLTPRNSMPSNTGLRKQVKGQLNRWWSACGMHRSALVLGAKLSAFWAGCFWTQPWICLQYQIAALYQQSTRPPLLWIGAFPWRQIPRPTSSHGSECSLRNQLPSLRILLIGDGTDFAKKISWAFVTWCACGRRSGPFVPPGLGHFQTLTMRSPLEIRRTMSWERSWNKSQPDSACQCFHAHRNMHLKRFERQKKERRLRLRQNVWKFVKHAGNGFRQH